MFSRGLPSKYKTYLHSFQSVKECNYLLRNNTLYRKCKLLLLPKDIKYSQCTQSAKDYIAKINYRQTFENVISVVQDKLNKKYGTSLVKENSQEFVKVQNVVRDVSVNKLCSTDKLLPKQLKNIENVYTQTSLHLNRWNIKNCESSFISNKFNKLENRLKSILKEKLQFCSSKTGEILLNLKRNKLVLCNSAGIAAVAPNLSSRIPVIEPIPEPPPIPEAIAETVSQVNALGEPTLESLGIGGWTPVGIIQNSLEYLHVNFDLPWWLSIMIGTLVVRLVLFPLVVISQRNAARMNNYMPQLQILQLKMSDARQTGNQLEVARYGQEMMIFMKEKGLNPFKNMIVPLAQMPVFVSFFIGLRKMANVPVDSLREGGTLWFTDLTVPDQYFALPIITSLTLWATIELGTDTAKLSSQNLQTMKYVLRALPVIILPFTVNFPGAILCYWVSSNFISLVQVGFLKIPTVRDYFKIEPLIKHNPENLPVKNKGFVGGIKDSWTNLKITKEIEERRRFDELQFQRAGKGPVVKTYKYNPTKQVNTDVSASTSAMSAKER